MFLRLEKLQYAHVENRSGGHGRVSAWMLSLSWASYALESMALSATLVCKLHCKIGHRCSLRAGYTGGGGNVGLQLFSVKEGQRLKMEHKGGMKGEDKRK